MKISLENNDLTWVEIYQTFYYHKHLQLQPHIEIQANPDLPHLQFLQVPLWYEHIKVNFSIVIGSCCHGSWDIFPSNTHLQVFGISENKITD